MKSRQFKKWGLTFAADLRVRPCDKPALARAWKRASQSDPKDPEVKRMITAIRSRKMPPVEVLEVKFKRGVQKGLFAKAPIKKGSVVGHYSGRLLRGSEVNVDSDYVFSFSEKPYQNWVIDGEKIGNHMRFVNHSKRVNLEAVELYWGKLPRIVFIATRDIDKGEQLFYNYGSEYWKIKGVRPDSM